MKRIIIAVLFFSLQSYFYAAETAQNDTIVYLNIPDRKHAQEAPAEGWCGEASIQMAAMYYGAFIPQNIIHELPDPEHPDLYSYEIPPALEKIGLCFSQYENNSAKTVNDYLEWIKHQLDQHYPVLIGCKIYPTHHPEWSLDHFMLAVGYTKGRLIYNTTWGFQESKSFDNLITVQDGISFENQYRRYYGISIQGFKNSMYIFPLHIFPINEIEYNILAQIRIDSLIANNEYQLVQFDNIQSSQQLSASQGREVIEIFKAEQSYHTITTHLPTDSVCIFRCIPGNLSFTK